MISHFLEVIIGMAFIYVLICLFVSGLNEWIAQKLGTRGKFLRAGLIRLIPDQAVYRRLLHHPLIEGLYRSRVSRGKIPSYVGSSNFVSALFDVVCTRAATMTGQQQNQGMRSFYDVYNAVCILNQHNSPLARALLPILDGAQGSLDSAIEGIQEWFNSGMDRVSGWYKERMRTQLFIVGICVSVLGNIDSVNLVQTLWRSPQLSAQLADEAAQAIESGTKANELVNNLMGRPATPDELEQLKDALVKLEADKLPIGFSCLGQGSIEVDLTGAVRQCWEVTKRESNGRWGMKIIGWLITALAVTLGAPFWFELLTRFVNLRGAGRRPQSGQAYGVN